VTPYRQLSSVSEIEEAYMFPEESDIKALLAVNITLEPPLTSTQEYVSVSVS
jgi:hypothetical protein